MVACLVAGLTAAGCSSEVPSLATSSAGTVDVTAVPVDSSLPAAVEIAVTVGVDSATDRVESIPLGATVKLTLLDPAAAEEYHVHGYELGDGVEIAKGVPEVFQFVANKPGDFEVESHKTETVLVILKVG
jgi:hypothetical protein